MNTFEDVPVPFVFILITISLGFLTLRILALSRLEGTKTYPTRFTANTAAK